MTQGQSDITRHEPYTKVTGLTENNSLTPSYTKEDVEAIDIIVKVAYPVDRGSSGDHSTIRLGKLIKSGANSYTANIMAVVFPFFYRSEYIHVLLSDMSAFDFSEYTAEVSAHDQQNNIDGVWSTTDHRILEDGIAFQVGQQDRLVGLPNELHTIDIETNNGKTITITFTETEKYAKFNDVIFDNIDFIETIPYGELSQGDDIIIMGFLLEPNMQYGLSILPYDEEGDILNITITSNADGNIETTYSGGDRQWSLIDLTDSEFQHLICSYTIYYAEK